MALSFLIYRIRFNLQSRLGTIEGRVERTKYRIFYPIFSGLFFNPSHTNSRGQMQLIGNAKRNVGVDCRLHIGYIIIGLNSKYIEHLVIDYSLHRHAELLAIAHLHAVSSQRKRIRIIETIPRMLYYCLHLKECGVSNQIVPV